MNKLVDACGRTIDYLRLSVTDRCDLRCGYCMPEKFCGYEEPDNWLNFDELERLVSIFARLGLARIRITGGEPLLRKGLLLLIQRLAALPGIDDLSLSTNGTQLVKFASHLRRAGVKRLNVSLDSLDRARIQRISGRDVLPDILAGLETARGEEFSMIKINMVALPDTSDDEIDAMVDYCIERGFILRLIETMPVGETGRRASFRNLQPVQARLREKFSLVDGIVFGGGPARYLVTPDGCSQIGFITPMSQHFCETCNRVRLSVDGVMHLCLGQEDRIDFRYMLNIGCTDADIEMALLAALQQKPERHEFNDDPRRITRIMASTGG